MWTAWDLARGAVEVRGVLDSVVVVIDPVTNPDGRDRYVQWFHSVMSATPNANPQAREHDEPWPGGRFNHYYFDLNRETKLLRCSSSEPSHQARYPSSHPVSQLPLYPTDRLRAFIRLMAGALLAGFVVKPSGLFDDVRRIAPTRGEGQG